MAESSEPKNETVRIMVSPSAMPAPKTRIDEIPMPLCWALLATSAVILILQIWNYLS
jgi:hypothetical protein